MVEERNPKHPRLPHPPEARVVHLVSESAVPNNGIEPMAHGRIDL